MMQLANKNQQVLYQNITLNLLNHQCCRVIQDTQLNLVGSMNTDVTDNHSNNHGVDTKLILKHVIKPIC